jgi:hypothetical protein
MASRNLRCRNPGRKPMPWQSSRGRLRRATVAYARSTGMVVAQRHFQEVHRGNCDPTRCDLGTSECAVGMADARIHEGESAGRAPQGHGRPSRNRGFRRRCRPEGPPASAACHGRRDGHWRCRWVAGRTVHRMVRANSRVAGQPAPPVLMHWSRCRLLAAAGSVAHGRVPFQPRRRPASTFLRQCHSCPPASPSRETSRTNSPT